MTRDEEDDMIGSLTIKSWKRWLKEGWLERLEAEFGPLDEQGRVILENGWKLGFSYSVGIGREMANEIISQMDEVGKN